MKAAVLHGKHAVTIEEIDRPKTDREQVLVKIHSAALCGSDLNLFVGNIKCRYPVVPGYCFSGLIEEVGSGITDLEERERVCGLNFGIFGAFAEYIAVSGSKVYRIPESVSFEEAAFIESVALALRSLRLTSPVKGRNVLILGQGSLGILHTHLFKKAGGVVFVADLMPSRLSLSRRFGADCLLDPRAGDILDQMYDKTQTAIEVVVEAAGSSTVVDILSRLPDAEMVLFSTWNPVINQFSARDARITKVAGASREDCLAALKMISEGKVDLSCLKSQRFPLSDIREAYSMLLNPSQAGRLEAVGLLINPQC